MMRSIYITFILLLISPLSTAAPLTFVDAYIPEAPPGAQTMAAYMLIINDSKQDRSITAVRSMEFGKVEMHRSFVENGIARMQAIKALAIPAASTLELKRGGLHLMLFEPKNDYMHGERVVLHLTEADGTEHRLVITIKKRTKPMHRHHE